MTDLKLYMDLAALPAHLKKEAEDFIEQLKSKAAKEELVGHRKFGSAKGFFIMHDDFDEPLEDFKEYM